jgi:hypothetical protein
MRFLNPTAGYILLFKKRGTDISSELNVFKRLTVYRLTQLRGIYNTQFVLLKITKRFENVIWTSSGDTYKYRVLY